MKKIILFSAALLLTGSVVRPTLLGNGLLLTAQAAPADALEGISASSAQPNQGASLAADGDAKTFWVSGEANPKPGQGPTRDNPQWIEFNFRTPVTVGSLNLVARPGYGPREGEVQISDDGQTFRTLAPFKANEATHDNITVTFAPTSAKSVRVAVFAAFDLRFPNNPRDVQIAEMRFSGKDSDGKDASWPSAAAPVSAPIAPMGGAVDVTAAVTAMVKNNELSVAASNALNGGTDPAHKIYKRLVVVYVLGGQEKTAAVMEGQTLKISAPAGQTLTVKKALYGNVAFPVIDVTELIKGAVANGKVSLKVDNKTLAAGGDPAHKRIKKLRVVYSVGAASKTLTLDEGTTLSLPVTGDGVGALIISSALYGALNANLNDSALSTMAPPPPAPIAMLPRPALLVTTVKPQRFEKRGDLYFADFGKDVFGNLQLTLPAGAAPANFSIRLGEKLKADGTIDSAPGGSINFQQLSLQTQAGQSVYRPEIPFKKGYQSGDQAIRTPSEIGNVTPFRYAEIESGALALSESNVNQLFVHTAFDDLASSFHSSDPTLDAVWKLCKQTMKATTAFGVYVDGERERRPYEADAYINQMSHYATDLNPEVARYSAEYLLAHPTWPTEWSFHMPMMAAADYEATGDTTLAARNYEALKKKLLMERAREDGLLRAGAIVDWPGAERDGYNDGKPATDNKQQVGPMINTVANAFYYHALQRMTLLARALKKTDDAALFESKAKGVYEAFNAKFFDAARGLYIDGEGSTHASLHANMFALAFDLVPIERQAKVADFVQSRGMACSVYGAQYLLESLYKAGKDDYALQLMTSKDERSWWHMIDLGSTMTLEAWDAKFKGNLTWNHPWGASPANIITRFLVGVRPLTPGYGEILIAPRPGTLKSFEAKIPTARGPVFVALQNGRYQIEVPRNTKARVALLGRKEEVVGAGKHVFEAKVRS